MVDNTKIMLEAIGTIHTPYKEARGTPIQASSIEAANVEATVRIFPQYIEGLKDLDGFSHVMLIYYFHLATRTSLLVTPFMDEQMRGVFSTRAPARPNHIGISVVRLVSMRLPEGLLLVRGIDIIDGTPLLDIKPYVPAFDTFVVERVGWLGSKDKDPSKFKDDGRFISK